jgi:hypothetical protein
MDSPFMQAIAGALAVHGILVVRFEFAYMAARRAGGARRPPPPVARLAEEYRVVLDEIHRPPAAIGGKSLGGRVASLIVDALPPPRPRLVCLGYPFHPPGQPLSLRTAHLEGLKAPALIVQGERDPFGTRAEVEAMALSPAISFHWALDGDHSLEPRRASGATLAANIAAAAAAVARFLKNDQSIV